MKYVDGISFLLCWCCLRPHNQIFFFSFHRLPSLSVEKTLLSKESVFTSQMLSPNMAIGSLIAQHDSEMVLGLKHLVAAVVG